MSQLPKSQRSSARRVDVAVRASNPHIKTEIHEIHPHHHVIFAPADQLSEHEYKREFDRSITPAGMRIDFSNHRPSKSTVIPGISDDNLVFDFEGMILTLNDFEMALQSMFPNAPELTASEIRNDGILEFWFEADMAEPLRGKIYDFLDRHVDLRTIEICTKKKNTSLTAAHRDDLIVNRPIKRRANVPSFVKSEEEWWYAHADDVVRGNLPKENLLSKKFTGAACYIQASMPGVNIRQALLAFDTIYLQPPIDDTPSTPAAFWESQGVTKEDILHLVGRDRIRIITSQPEERCDLRFLEAAKECNPEGVLGRRKTAAVILSDIVDTDKSYLFSRPTLARDLQEAIKRLANDLDVSQSDLARSVLFPKFAKRSWVSSFQGLGAMGIEPYGQGELFARALEAVNGKSGQDPRLEAYLFGENVQIAHSLGGTYLPHGSGEDYVNSWIAPMRLMGDRLNFYRAFNDKTAAAWAENQRLRIENKLKILPPVPLFEFNRHAPVGDIDSFTTTSSRMKGRSLIGRLADLPISERGPEIERLQKELYAFQGKQDRKRTTQTWLETGVDVADTLLDFGLGPFMSGLTLLSKISEVARRSPTLDILISEIERSLTRGSNEDLDFLDKISRVAWLKVEP